MRNQISEIQIRLVKPQNGLIGFASFVYDNSIYLSSIGILTKLDGGYRLTYPTKKVGETSIGIYHPIKREVSKQIEKEVIKKVNDIFNDGYKKYKSL